MGRFQWIAAAASVVVCGSALAAGQCAEIGKKFIEDFNRDVVAARRSEGFDSIVLWHRKLIPMPNVYANPGPPERGLWLESAFEESFSLKPNGDLSSATMAQWARAADRSRAVELGMASNLIERRTYDMTSVYLPSLFPVRMEPFKIIDTATLGVRTSTSRIACEFYVQHPELGVKPINFKSDWRVSDSGRVVDGIDANDLLASSKPAERALEDRLMESLATKHRAAGAAQVGALESTFQDGIAGEFKKRGMQVHAKAIGNLAAAANKPVVPEIMEVPRSGRPAHIGAICPEQVKPEIPRKALQEGVSGVVRAQATIDGSMVTNVVILDGPKVFHESIISAMKKYKCRSAPGTSITAIQEFEFRTE